MSISGAFSLSIYLSVSLSPALSFSLSLALFLWTAGPIDLPFLCHLLLFPAFPSPFPAFSCPSIHGIITTCIHAGKGMGDGRCIGTARI
jgi:hypothetical protein